MRLTALVAAIFVSTIVATQAMAQATGDPKVGAALKQAGFESCTVDKDGDYACVVQISDTRTEAVWVMSKPAKVGGIERRKIFSVGYVASGPLSASEAAALLEENSRYNFGAWEIQQADGKTRVVFAGYVDVNATAAQLGEVFALVAVAADQTEEARTGKDEF